MPLPNPGTPPTIDALPEAPLRNQDGPTFNNKAAAFVSALDPFGDDVDAVGTWMKSAADYTAEQAGFAGDSATAAEQSADDAAAIAVTAGNFKGAWSGLTGALAVPATVYHNGKYWQLLSNVADVTTAQPGVSASWALSARSNGRTVIATPITLTVPDRYYVTGTGTTTLPTSAGQPAGTSWDFFFESPSSTTKLAAGTNEFDTKRGQTNELIADRGAVELIINGSSKYKVTY